MRILNLTLMTIIILLASACGEDKPAGSATDKAVTAVESPTVEAPGPVAVDNEYGRILNHLNDEVEFKLRRSIGGLERMIEQYTADGYDTAELEAQRADLSAELDSLTKGS
ncbi:MAG: hypothetical protein ACI9SC_001679 [Gammaproteobacteria bacterium]